MTFFRVLGRLTLDMSDACLYAQVHKLEEQMADGDRLHQSLGLSYQQPYRQLCEGFVQLDEQARNLAKRVKRDLERCHPHVATSFSAVTERLVALSEKSKAQTEQIDARIETQELRRLAARCTRKREGALLVEAAQPLLNDLASGVIPDQIGEALGRKFTERLYKAQFGDVVLTPTDNAPGLKPPDKEDLSTIQSHIRSDLDDLGSQFSQSIQEEKPHLRLRPRRRAANKIDDLDADITDVFKKD